MYTLHSIAYHIICVYVHRAQLGYVHTECTYTRVFTIRLPAGVCAVVQHNAAASVIDMATHQRHCFQGGGDTS